MPLPRWTADTSQTTPATTACRTQTDPANMLDQPYPTANRSAQTEPTDPHRSLSSTAPPPAFVANYRAQPHFLVAGRFNHRVVRAQSDTPDTSSRCAAPAKSTRRN